jgi:hypothetical protein
MKASWVQCVALVTVCAGSYLGAGEPNVLTPEERAAGWTLLFDGGSTRGWRSFKKKDFPAQGWVVDAGCLKHTAKGGGGDIITEAQFDQFDLRWEWKIAPKSNSGLKYFVTENRSSALGHEYQMIDDGPGGPKAGLGTTASFYAVVPAPATKKLNSPGEWNESRILVRGNHVEHWLNGEKVLDYELGSDAVKEAVARSKFRSTPGFGTRIKGHLLLQDHGGEACFRNIKILDLSGK